MQPSKLTLGGPADFEATVLLTVISSISKNRNLGPKRIVEGLQKYNLKGPKDPWQLELI